MTAAPMKPSEALRPNKDETGFLSKLVERGGSDVSIRLCFGLADRANDRARQGCRRRGWARFKSGVWHITDDGRKALAESAGQ